MDTVMKPHSALRTRHSARGSSQDGFSLIEALIAVSVLLILFTAATNGLNQTAIFSRVVGNRTEMHGSVRGATELMQQEIGQAGRVALPGPIATTGAVLKGAGTITLSTVTGLFVGAKVVVGTNDQTETVTITALGASDMSGVFAIAHNAGEPVSILGAFSSGVVPASMANGSTGTVLKLYGDINDDGQMLYVEYTCDTAAGYLYRNVMPWTAAAKPVKTASMIILNNVIANPGNAACFSYQTEVVLGTTYVTGVAVTLSVRSQQRDQFSKTFQTATKTLLNVSPRNIFLIWTMASIGVTNRQQPMPASVLALLP